MVNRIVSILLLSISPLLSIQAQSDTWKDLNKENFSVQYPGDWELNETGQMGTTFILFSPLDSPEDSFKDNVNFMIQDISAYNLNLDSYIKLTKDQLGAIFQDSKLLTSERMNKDGVASHHLVYAGIQGERNLKFVQYIWVIEKKAYLLTFTAEKSEFEKFKAIQEKIFESFQLKLG